MSKKYPHLDDTKFPDIDTLNVYKYGNEFDYNAYEESTKIKLLSVPWCGDYENTVFFETKDARDAWFDSQDGETKIMPTMFRLYADGDIKVELPIDECMKYNYAMIDYGKLPMQESDTAFSKMFYFVSDMRQDSANTTRLVLSVDFWTSYIYDMGITYVTLEQGHAPLAATNVENYLENPLDNSEYLLVPDANFGSLQRVANTSNMVFNEYTGNWSEDVVLGFQTSASMERSWQDGDGNPWIPTAGFESSQAFSCIDPFILDDITRWEEFRETVMQERPQFFTTVKGMFVMPRKLITVSTSFTFCGFTCHFLATTGSLHQGDFKVSKNMFGYDDGLSDLAKLYTSPYAAIEVSDFKGSTMMINVEDTAGAIGIDTVMCDMYPFMNVEAYLTGVGSSKKSTLRFQNRYTSTMEIGGRFYDFTTKWNIPVFAVQLDTEASWELNGKINADASLQNTKDTAANITENAALQIAANSANTSEANTLIEKNNAVTVQVMDDKTQRSILATLSSVNAEISAADSQATVSGNAITAKAAASAAVGAATSVASTVASAVSGNVGEAVNSAVGGVASIISGVVNAGVDYSAMMDGVQISNDLKKSVAEINNSANNYFKDRSIYNNNTTSGNQIEYNNATTGNTNEMTESSAENSADTMVGNAQRSYNAGKKQYVLKAPPEYGQLTGTQDVISKPFGLQFNVVTQSKSAIRQAGEQFLRYGYKLGLQWKLGTFNVMPRFSYWKCSSVYCGKGSVYEGAQSMVKSILEAGTTIWREPSDIGNTSIYENE